MNDVYAAHRLYQLWVDNRCVYGRRKLWKAAQRSGWDIGRDKVDRLMRILGIEGITRRRRVRTTITNPKTPRFNDLVKRAWKNIDRPDQCWVADFTYVFTTSGVCYTAFITDVYTREILSFITDTKAKSHLVIRALQQAIRVTRRRDRDFSTVGVIHHSDAGCQYTSQDLRNMLEEYNMNRSIGTVGDAYDNGLMESTIGLYKTELIYKKDKHCWHNWETVEAATADWVNWYNNHRLHSSIKTIPPLEYRATHTTPQQPSCLTTRFHEAMTIHQPRVIPRN